MAEDRGSNGPNRPGPGGTSGPNSRWPRVVQYVFVVLLTVLLLMLAVSMRRHHFGEGELYERSHPESR
jgi:hypothetical protein